MHANTHTYLVMYVHRNIHIYVHAHVCMHVNVNIHTCIHTCRKTFMRKYTFNEKNFYRLTKKSPHKTQNMTTKLFSVGKRTGEKKIP